MKKLLVITLIVGLLGASTAFAAPTDYTDLDPYAMDPEELAQTFIKLRDEYAEMFGEQEEETPAEQIQEEKPQVETVGEGQHKVGSDIPAGTYVIFRKDSDMSGYYFLTKDANGHDYIDSDGFDYNGIIYCPDGAYLELSNAYAVPIEANPEVDTSGDGCFIGGLHIPVGEYKLERIEDDMSGYYFLYTDSTHDNYISSDSFDTSVYVNVGDGQLLQLSNSRIVW